MRSLIYGNPDMCTGCEICRMVCSQVKTGGTNPRSALLRLEKRGLLHVPLVCAQCRNAFCLQVCPVEAIYRDSETGAVLIREEDCTGCGLCVQACQYGLVIMDGDHKIARKCDLCGGQPACVRYCPAGALEMVTAGGESSA